jgi:hypothetical protein
MVCREQDRSRPVDLGSRLRGSFGVTALAALDRAAAASTAGRPADTLGVLLALTVADAAAAWDRIWLEFGELDPSAAGRYLDPLTEEAELWNGRPVTESCGRAIRAAVELAGDYDLMPVSAGVLTLCLVADAASAASQALAATSGPAHSLLLELVQEALVGGSWRDVEAVLKQSLDQASMGSVTDDPDVESFLQYMGDEIEALVRVLGQFLRASTPAESGSVLDMHPELLSARIDKLIGKFIGEATQAGDTEGARRLRERRTYLGNYRRLVGKPLQEEGAVERYGECPPTAHVLTQSIVSEPGYTSTAIRCDLCHVGCVLDMRADDGVMHIEYFVFPADGCDQISSEMTMWAVGTCEGSIRDMEEQGVPLRRSTPVIGFRPDSLRKHTTFIRDS